MPKRKRFGELSKAARDRAERAGKEYGLNRAAVRGRYNRGTYNPLSRDPLARLPREVRLHADPETGEVDWQDLALENIRRHLSHYFKYIDDSVVFFTQRMNVRTARIVSMATEDELLKYASPQPIMQRDGTFRPPPIEQWGLPPDVTLADVSVMVNGEWNNIFWYH
jgi:hypothetical protein